MQLIQIIQSSDCKTCKVKTVPSILTSASIDKFSTK